MVSSRSRRPRSLGSSSIIWRIVADLLVQGGDERLNRGLGSGRGGVQAIALHLPHLEQLFDPAQQGLKFADRGWRWIPAGRLTLLGKASDQFGVGGIRLGAAQFALGKGFDLCGIDHADPETVVGQEFGERHAVGAGRLQGDADRSRPEASQPSQEGGKALGRVIKDLVAVLAVLHAGGIELLLDDIDADGNKCGMTHGEPLRSYSQIWCMSSLI